MGKDKEPISQAVIFSGAEKAVDQLQKELGKRNDLDVWIWKSIDSTTSCSSARLPKGYKLENFLGCEEEDIQAVAQIIKLESGTTIYHFNKNK